MWFAFKQSHTSIFAYSRVAIHTQNKYEHKLKREKNTFKSLNCLLFFFELVRAFYFIQSWRCQGRDGDKACGSSDFIVLMHGYYWLCGMVLVFHWVMLRYIFRILCQISPYINKSHDTQLIWLVYTLKATWTLLLAGFVSSHEIFTDW